jgi:hypothetical protein
MDNLKIVMYILLAYLGYKLLFSKEGFAFSTNTTDDPTKLDLGKYYVVGKRTVSNTVTPATNGGKGCDEYKETAYQLAPAKDAVCKGEIMDSYYTFGAESTSKVGAKLFPFKVQYNRAPAFYIHPQGGAVTPGDMTKLVWFTGFTDKSPKNGFTMADDGTIRHSGSTDLCVGRGGADVAELSKGACDGNHKYDVLPNGALKHQKSGLCLMAYEDTVSNGNFVKFGDCSNQAFSGLKLLYQQTK